MLVKSHLSYIHTYVLSAKDRHMMVKMHFLLIYLHTCRPIKFMLFYTSHLFPSPTQVKKSGHPFTFTIVNDTTQQTRCRRCPPNQMPTYDRWLLAKKHPFSYMLTYVLCINDRYKSVKIVFSYLFTYILMPCWLKSSLLHTSCLRMTNANSWKVVIFLFTYLHSICEWSKQIGKSRLLHSYLRLRTVNNRHKLVKSLFFA